MFPKTEQRSVFRHEPENTWHSPNAMRGVLDVGDFIPKARRRLRLLNTALHLAELVRLLAVFPRMMQSIILQRQFELIHLGFTPTPLSGESPLDTA